MGSEGVLRYLQVPATCPYPGLNESSPCLPIPLLKDPFIILSSHLCLGLPSGLLPSGFSHQNPVYISPVPPYVPHYPPPHASCFDHPAEITPVLVIAGQKIPAFFFRVPYQFFRYLNFFLCIYSTISWRNAYRCSTKHCFIRGRVFFVFMFRSVPIL